MPILSELSQGESFNWGPSQSSDESEDSIDRKNKKVIHSFIFLAIVLG